MAEEVFFYAYPETVTCADPHCYNSMTRHKLNAEIMSPTLSTQFSVATANQGLDS